ncbi:MAG: 4-(cytidine 5'-diphospho)-2-C-methyl-D-erythritol kinase [Aquiluna sp.]|jgi:4-diphosphocytidyl-2C-methyl-D-erythritol kinase
MITAVAPAKINLAFFAGPVRPDGYHDVVSVYQALELLEKVSVEPSADWVVEITGAKLPEASRIPNDKANLVVKAGLALAAHVGLAKTQPMRFVIEKQVPPAAGVAGGSADAAASLIALNTAWGLGLSSVELSKVAAKVGADVPFALLGGTALGVGTGVELTSLEPFGQQHVLLVLSTPGLATADVFREFDSLKPAGDFAESSYVRHQYLTDPAQIIGYNSLQAAAFSLRKDLPGIAETIPGQKAFVSGSGPTLYLLSKDQDQIITWAAKFEALGLKTLLTRTSRSGSGLES